MPDEVPSKARELLDAVETLCGEANEAARLAEGLLEGSQLKEARRALARCMELMDQDVLPHLYEKFPQLRQPR
jgi:hypothetical protein